MALPPLLGWSYYVPETNGIRYAQRSGRNIVHRCLVKLNRPLKENQNDVF